MAMQSGLRARLNTAAVVLLVFGAGLSTGLAWDRGSDSAPAEQAARSERQEDRRPDRGRSDRGSRPLLVEQVGLSVEQKTEIDAIVEDSRRRMRNLEKETQPRYRTIIEETRAAIKEVLTEEQRVEYDAILAEREQRRQAEREQRRRERSDSNRDSGK